MRINHGLGMEVIGMNGIKVFEGVGMGLSFVHQEVDMSQLVKTSKIDSTQVEEVMAKFNTILSESIEEVEALKLHAQTSVGDEEAQIFEAHKMMLEDPMLIDEITTSVTLEQYALDWAIYSVRERLVSQFMAIDNEYIRARAQDIIDVTDRLLKKLFNIAHTSFSQINEPTVIIAKDLKPSETIMLNDHVVGILLEVGSATSHAAIVAKAKGIPTLVGLTGISEKIPHHVDLIIDVEAGKFYIEPDDEIKKHYSQKLLEQKAEKLSLAALKDEEAITPDGRSIHLYGNVGSLQEAKWVKEQGAKGIGLLRTELIYMESQHMPTEDEQVNYYRPIVELMPEGTIIRTLDIGGDKHLPYYQFQEEMNPFLGERAIRLCLRERALFITQLRAILRVSVFGKVKIMIPMISNLEEILEVKQILSEVKNDLRQEGISFDETIQMGIMIEIPSAALAADILAREVDFFSIGTNDLCQYTCAVDRMNTSVAHLYQPLHPGVLKLIQMTVDGAKSAGIDVGVCGETAGNKDMAMLFMAMGMNELSMSASMINRVKKAIRETTFTEMENLLKMVRQTSTAQAAIEKLEEMKVC